MEYLYKGTSNLDPKPKTVSQQLAREINKMAEWNAI